MINIILMAIISAFVCVGVDILFSDGMLLGGIRNWLETFFDKAENRKQFELAAVPYSNETELDKAVKIDRIERKYMRVDLMRYLLKPFVLCVYCFSSVYGLITYAAITGDTNLIDWQMAVLNSVLCLPLVGFIHAKYTRYVG